MLEAVSAVMVFDYLPLTLQMRVWLSGACPQRGKIVHALGHEPQKSGFKPFSAAAFSAASGSHQRWG